MNWLWAIGAWVGLCSLVAGGIILYVNREDLLRYFFGDA
jgi:hypothetical protein